MGFNKSYVDKDSILKNILLNNLSNQLNSDAIICMDLWSNKFLTSISISERKIRESLIEKYQFESSHSFINDSNFKSLKSLSECLINLITNPHWIDIIITIDKLNLSIDKTEIGNFNILKDKCIEAIIESFD